MTNVIREAISKLGFMYPDNYIKINDELEELEKYATIGKNISMRDDDLRDFANWLHETQCHQSHDGERGCGFHWEEYFNKEFGKELWGQSEHMLWLKKAKSIIKYLMEV